MNKPVKEQNLEVSTVQDITERVRELEKLSEANRRLSATVSAIPDLMFETDIQGRIYDYYAPASEKLYAQPEEFIGKMVADVLPPDAADIILKALTQATAEGVHRGAAYSLNMPGGRHWYELSIATKPGDTATEPHLVVLARDITERKQAEEALRERQETFRLAMDATNDALWDWNIVTNEVYRNPRHATMLGYEPQDFSSSQDEWEKRIYPDDRQRVFDCLNAHLKGETPGFAIEYRLRTKSGDYLWVLGRGKIVAYDSAGKPARLIGTNVDISERKHAEEALKESEEILQTIFASTPDSITVVDLDGTVKLCNPSTADIHGFSSAEQLIGKNLSELVAEEDHPRMIEAKKQVMLLGVAKNIPFTGLKDNGERFIGELSFSVLKDSSCRPVGFVGITRDITERKQAEEALQQSEERFRQVAETVSDFVWEIDTDGLYKYASPSVEKILGYTPGELVGKMHFYDLFVPEFREQLKADAFGAFKSRQRFQAFSNTNLSKSGKIVYLETSGMPVLDEAGRLLGYRGADTDVTDRR
jgi:PAS domain S-box-containing protein